MLLLSLALVLLALHYAAVLGRCAWGWRRVVEGRTERQAVYRAPAVPPFVSVVVPARDRAGAIAACLEALLANDYPADRFEVIVVDDHSSDGTWCIVELLQARYNRALAPSGTGPEGEPEDGGRGERLRLLRLRNTPARAHKRYALTRGVAAARGDLILVTDADAVVPPSWIRTTAACFAGDVGFVSGPVLHGPGRAGGRLRALERLGLVALGAGAIGLGRPVLCDGANVAFRRRLFEAVGGYAALEPTAHGDDELLMQKIAETTPWRVRFCPDAAAVVLAAPAATRATAAWLRRWASKGLRTPRRRLVATLAAIYGFHSALLTTTVLLARWPGLLPAVAAAWALKLGAEAAVLVPAARHFGRKRLLPYGLIGQPLHLLVVVLLAPIGLLGGPSRTGRPADR